ncbi:MAG: SGNH/GDSL hydrolase family protein [Isosphaeraceae bacterium]
MTRPNSQDMAAPHAIRARSGWVLRLAGPMAVLCLIAAWAPSLRAQGAFALHDGDRVVFYGDSITDQRLYTTFAETYVVTRFPTMKVSFVHSGWGGDRVTGGGGGPIDLRLKRDVFAYKPTVVTVMLGMNDASYQPFKQPIFDTYSEGYRHLVLSLKSNLPGVRLTLIVPSPFDDVTRPPAFEGGYNQVLIRYGEFVRSLAQKEGATVADLNTPVVAALKKANELDRSLAPHLISDRVHPGPGGQLLMAEALLKAWNATPLVSAVEIDASAGKATRQDNTRLDDLKTGETITWTQTDASLPMPINLKDPVIALAARSSDVEQALNQQTLRVTGLTASNYRLRIDGKDVAELHESQLRDGVNLAELDTPMMHQATTVHHLTLRHNDIHFDRWRAYQVPMAGANYASLPRVLEALDALEAEMLAEREREARPVAHRFELVQTGK